MLTTLMDAQKKAECLFNTSGLKKLKPYFIAW